MQSAGAAIAPYDTRLIEGLLRPAAFEHSADDIELVDPSGNVSLHALVNSGLVSLLDLLAYDLIGPPEIAADVLGFGSFALVLSENDAVARLDQGAVDAPR